VHNAYVCTQVLPEPTAERAIVEATDNALMDVAGAACRASSA
jgi:hypothetical protein